MTPRYLFPAFLLALILGQASIPIYAQEQTAVSDDATTPPVATDAAATQPASTDADAEQAMRDLLGTREAAPIIEPSVSSSKGQAGIGGIVPVARIDIDPAVLGVAPGEDPPPLRREGEFIINRRGRLLRSPDGGYLLFVFEADSSDAPELPMVLQACQLLETMEDTIERRGDTVVFILSGQINTYRGANYLLPTVMKIAMDKGNITN